MILTMKNSKLGDLWNELACQVLSKLCGKSLLHLNSQELTRLYLPEENLPQWLAVWPVTEESWNDLGLCLVYTKVLFGSRIVNTNVRGIRPQR